MFLIATIFTLGWFGLVFEVYKYILEMYELRKYPVWDTIVAVTLVVILLLSAWSLYINWMNLLN